MNWLFVALAVFAGALLPLQALINARLGHAIGGTLMAAAVSFVVGTVALLAIVGAQRQPLPAWSEMARLPTWIWTGGLIGAVYVAIAILAVPRLGAAALIALVVLGQMVASLALDQFGVLQNAHPINAVRVLGAALVLAGVVLVMQPWQAR
jgi:transporter family-2 protein